MEKVTAAIIRNPFDPLNSREVREFEPGITVGQAMQDFFPLATAGYDWTVAINGKVIDGDYRDIILKNGNSLSFCATPQGGGGGSKNPLAIVAMLAVVVAAPMVGAAFAASSMGTAVSLAFGTASLGTVAMFASAAFVVGGGMLISSMFPAKMPGMDGIGSGESFERSQTYGWQAGANVREPGQSLPVLFGKHRVVPPLVAKYVETQGDKQYLNLLYAVAGHLVDDIHTIQVNDQPVSNFDAVRTEVSLGGNWQTPFPMFEDQRSDVPMSVKMSTAWVTRQTGDCDKFGIGIVAPRGMYYANDKGGLSKVQVSIETQYRLIGSATWRDWLGHSSYSLRSDFSSRESTRVFTTESHNLASRLQTGSKIQSYAGGVAYAEHTVTRFSKETDTNTSIVGHGRDRKWITTRTEYSQIKVSGPALPVNMSGYAYANPFNLSGRQNSPKRWFFEVPTPEDGFGKYEYRIRFVIAPPSSSRYGSELFLDYHQEIVSEPLEYPNTALIAVRALATDQLSGAEPRISCIAERNTVDIDGTDYPANNPAWANVHMLTDDLNGGEQPLSRIDVAKYEQWADNCTAKNLECNIYFDDAVSLKKAMDMVGTIGRGQTVQMGSQFTCLTDFPDTAVQRFSFGMGNIESDSFSEEWLPTDERADEIEVTFWDAENDYKRTTLTIQQEGYDSATTITNKQSIPLYGCTDRSLASHHAKFLLNKNKYLTLTAAWGADVDALACMPGNVVDVSHDVPQWGYSGRLVHADGLQVELDREVTLEPGETYVVDVRHGDDTRETKTVAAVGETTATDTLTLTSAWDNLPSKYDIYSFGRLGRQYKQFRILNLTKDQDLRRRVTALEYVPEVYNDAVSIPAPPPSEIAYVKDFRAREAWVPGSDGSGRSVIDVSWRGGDGLRWNVYFQRPDSDWELIAQTFETNYRVDKSLSLNSSYGVAVSLSGPAGGAIAHIQIRGVDPIPSDVESLKAWQFGGEIYLRWPHIADVNMWGYEIREGVSWEKGRIVVDGIQENEARYNPTRKGTHQFWIKALSNSEKYSVNATSTTLNVVYFKDLNVVREQEEIPDGVADADLFNFVLADDGKLYWTPSLTDTDVPNMLDTDPAITDYDGGYDPGVYTSQVYDLLKVVPFTLRIETEWDAILTDATDLTYPDRTDLTYPLDTDISITSLSNLNLEFRLSDDNVTWGEWEEFTAPADVVGRYVQIRFSTVLDSNDVRFSVTQCTNTADVPDQVAELQGEAIGSGGATYSLATDFSLDILVIYTVSVTALGTLPRYPVVDKHADTFDIKLFDGSGNAVSGNADITVRGY